MKFKQLGDIKEIGLVFICVLPCFLLYLKTQHSLFVTMGLIASSSIIVFYKIRFGFINVLFHLLQILLVTLILAYSRQSPILFSFICAAVCSIYIGISQFGRHLRIYGMFVIIPALYIASELYSEVLTGYNPDAVSDFLRFFPLLALPAVICALLLNLSQGKSNSKQRKLWHPDFTGEPVKHAYVTASGIFIAVWLIIQLAYWLNINHIEWIVWSTVSVCTGEIVSMHKRAKHRLLGVLTGIGSALLLVYSGIQIPFLNAAAVLLIPLTIPLNNYLFAFSLRCFLGLAATGVLITGFSLEKLLAVLVGGAVGVLLSYFVTYIHQSFTTYKASE